MFRAALLLIAVIVPACSRSTSNSSYAAGSLGVGENDETAREELARIEDGWARALETHDTTFFLRVLAPDFYATENSTRTFGRAGIIANAADRTTQVRNLHDEERQIRVYGDGTVGVITGLSRWTIEQGGDSGRYIGRYTEVYVKRHGRWQAIVGHYSNIPAAGQE